MGHNVPRVPSEQPVIRTVRLGVDMMKQISKVSPQLNPSFTEKKLRAVS